MTEQLIVRLGATPQEPVQWLVWSTAEQDIIASGELTHAEQLISLKDRAGSRPVTVLVPASDVLLHWVTMPAKASRKALTAIPYMLEDELCSDIDSQFFAMGPRQGNQQAVAVVNRDSLQQWLSHLQQAGLTCHKLLPDVLALPVQENGWSLLQIGEQLLIRQDQWKGLQGETSWMLDALLHHAKQLSEPLSIANYSSLTLPDSPNLLQQAEPLEMPMKVLAQGALASQMNLLQGEFKPKRQQQGQWQKWRLAAILAGIALSTSLIDKGIQASQLASQKEQLDAQIEAEFKRAFPEVKRIVNVRSQMNQKLNELQQGGGGASMLVMLSQLSTAFAQSKVLPQTLKFDGKRAELRMQAMADNFEALEQFRRLAEGQGFTVEQGAINNTDSKVVGSLSVRS
ncbi:type II secretion system protein GspL [Bowmanella yangjiangensis]|uniref:Type II secretion system protein L n=1 Tax=Bowmanella yangjiangensis TaxID=2811230 RepID=A0ABS3CRL1_9ALTE|nr:type II secretion system protein GspL [Bowmanella yangjiangensis]MBN7819164.1 type II secretion system protein GspL [Bowmanella yangjiangensis]